MSIRAHFIHDLGELQQRLQRLAELVEHAMAQAIWALGRLDTHEAQRVIAGDNAIDTLRYEMEELAIQIIARQQPLAGDLRVIIALLGLASELERIGDYAEGIADITLRCARCAPLPLPPGIHTMAQRARDMLRQSIQAVVSRDPGAGERLNQLDDEIDALYNEQLQHLLVVMREHPEQSEAATYLLWVAHNLERIADRTVNIGERATYVATGTLDPHAPPGAH